MIVVLNGLRLLAWGRSSQSSWAFAFIPRMAGYRNLAVARCGSPACPVIPHTVACGRCATGVGSRHQFDPSPGAGAGLPHRATAGTLEIKHADAQELIDLCARVDTLVQDARNFYPGGFDAVVSYVATQDNPAALRLIRRNSPTNFRVQAE